MIRINLLPEEYRKPESTPIGRFITIIVGAVLVTGGLVAYGYVHYSKLRGVIEVREATEAEYANKKAQADVSKSLQAEISAYQSRRKAIQEIVKRLREKGLGLLITDHSVRETLNATDRAYLMCEGRILISGTAEELAEDPTARKIYLGPSFRL